MPAREVATMLGVTPRTVSNMVTRGQLHRIKLGRKISRYSEREVAALIAASTQNDERPAATPSVREVAASPAHESS